jgi:hypothetical protein
LKANLHSNLTHINKRTRYIGTQPAEFPYWSLMIMATAKRPRSTRSKKLAQTSEPETVQTTTRPEVGKANQPELARITTQAVDLQDVIRIRAYEIYTQRGYSHGFDLEDWLRAESEVLARFGASAA